MVYPSFTKRTCSRLHSNSTPILINRNIDLETQHPHHAEWKSSQCPSHLARDNASRRKITTLRDRSSLSPSSADGSMLTHPFDIRPARSSDQPDPHNSNHGSDPRLDHVRQQKNSVNPYNEQTNSKKGFVHWTILSLKSL